MKFWKAYAIGLGFLVLLGAATTIPSQLWFKCTGTGCVSRPIAQKEGDVLSAPDLGIKCDGSDEHVVIQAALNSLAAGQSLYFPAPQGGGIAFCGLGTTGVTMGQATTGRAIVGAAFGSVVWSYTGSGVALTVGTSAAETQNWAMRNIGIDLGSAAAGAGAVQLIRVTHGAFEDVNITGTTAPPELGTGILLDGTGGYSGTILFKNVWITGNYTKGIWCKGGAGINTCNNPSFESVLISRTTAQPGTGTIGLWYGVNAGDGNAVSINVEKYDTGYQIDGGYLRGQLRFENNGVGVAFGATAHHNWVVPAPFTNVTEVTWAGGQFANTYLDLNSTSWALTGTQGLALVNRNSDNALVFALQAGSTADQNATLAFRDRLGVEKWRIIRSAFDAFLLQDGGGNYKLAADSGAGGGMRIVTGLALTRTVTNWAATVNIDASLGNIFEVPASSNIAHTIGAPTNTNSGSGQRIVIRIKNTSGGALAATGWNATYKMAAWVDPANAFSASIEFMWDGTNWVEVARGGTTVPN